MIVYSDCLWKDILQAGSKKHVPVRTAPSPAGLVAISRAANPAAFFIDCAQGFLWFLFDATRVKALRQP
jgi:hypothetical protein